MKKQSMAVLGVTALVSMLAVTSVQAGGTTERTQTTTSTSTTTVVTPNRAEAGKLIGQSVTTTSGERIGEVEAVNIGTDGKVTNVIVGVGGFLGVGERDVALGWKDLSITDNGGKVVANVTKSRIESMEPYSYTDPKHRGTVFESSMR